MKQGVGVAGEAGCGCWYVLCASPVSEESFADQNEDGGEMGALVKSMPPKKVWKDQALCGARRLVTIRCSVVQDSKVMRSSVLWCKTSLTLCSARQ